MDRSGHVMLGAFLFSICAIVLMLAVGAAEAKEHKIICDTREKECDGLIAEKLAQADVKDGDTIALDGPYFSETNLTISKSITLKGINTSMVLNTYSVELKVNGTRIEGMSIFLNTGMMIDDVHGWSLDNVVLSLYYGPPSSGGLLVKDATNWSITASRFEYFKDNDGARIEASSNFSLSDVVFRSGGTGMRVTGSRDFTVTDATFMDISTGIYAQDCMNMTVSRAMATLEDYGIVLKGTVNSTIKDSGFFGPTSDMLVKGVGIVFVGADGVSLINSTVLLCDYGVAMNYSTNVTVRQNTIGENLIGLAVLASPGLTLKDNALVEPLLDPDALLIKFSSDGTGTGPAFDAKGNYWSVPEGMQVTDYIEGNVDTSGALSKDPTPDQPPKAIKPFPTKFTMEEDGKLELVILSEYFTDDTWYWERTPFKQYIYDIEEGDNSHLLIYVGEEGCSGECIGNPWALMARAGDDWNGQQAVTLTIIDWRMRSVTVPTFMVEVTPVNDVPSIMITTEVTGQPVIKGRIGDEVRFNYTIYDDGPAVRVEAWFGDSEPQVLEENAQCLNASGFAGIGMPVCARGTFTLKFDMDLNGTTSVHIKVSEKYGTDPRSSNNTRTVIFENLSLGESEGGPFDLFRALVGIFLLAGIMLAGGLKGRITSDEATEKPAKKEEDEEANEEEEEADEEKGEEEEKEEEEEADEEEKKDEEEEDEGEEEEDKDD